MSAKAPTYGCYGVEVFEVGTHRGKPYTTKDLADMVRNFTRFSIGPDPKLNSPAVLGHEERQELLENSGLPAAGWQKRLWRHDGKLKANTGGIPESIKKQLDDEQYLKTSAELYDEPPASLFRDRAELLAELKHRGFDADAILAEAQQWAPQEAKRQQEMVKAGTLPANEAMTEEELLDKRLCQPMGKMLRRLALLGAEIPQVKSLKNLPKPVPEKYRARQRATWVSHKLPAPLKFSEEKRPMANLQALIDALVKAGVKAEEAPKVLDELMPLMSGEAAAPAPMADDPPPEAKVFDRAAAIAELAADGMEPAALESMTDQELQDQLEQKRAQGAGAADMADTATPTVAAPVKAAAPVTPTVPTQQHPNKVVMHYAEQAEARLLAVIAQTKALEKSQQDNIKATQINAFMETMRSDSNVRVTPAMEPLVRDMLVKCDNTKVLKFSEGGKTVEKTELQLQMEKVRALPVLTKLGEKHLPGRGTGSTTADDKSAKLATVSQFAEKHSTALSAVGQTKGSYVKRFEKRLENEPDLTAEEYCNVRA